MGNYSSVHLIYWSKSIAYLIVLLFYCVNGWCCAQSHWFVITCWTWGDHYKFLSRDSKKGFGAVYVWVIRKKSSGVVNTWVIELLEFVTNVLFFVDFMSSRIKIPKNLFFCHPHNDCTLHIHQVGSMTSHAIQKLIL